MKNERSVSEIEGKTYFSRRLKQFDGLTRLTLAPPPYFMTDLRQCMCKLDELVLNQGANWCLV